MSNKIVFAGALLAALSISVEVALAHGPFHEGSWPVQDGFNRQPTEGELRALHDQDLTRAQAREIDRLYDQLMSSSNTILRRKPAPP
jgi:hypothetical protein